MADNYLRQVIDHAQHNQRLKGTMGGIFYQTAYAAAGAGTGGLLAGPLGAMLGTMVGAVYGYANSNDYSNVFGIIRELDDEERESLTSTIRNQVGGMTFTQFVEWFKDLDHQATFMQLLFTYLASTQRSSTSRR
uniref:Uncharacterized protein n=1 Tax=Caenorhabditis japonica TaxID=281687 RepID=A0A8R1HI43_CAEJA